MIGVNKVMLVGELCERPELRYTPEGTAVACFSIAVTRACAGPGMRTQRDTDCFGVVAWRDLAEYCHQELEPGMCVCLEGRLKNHTWRDVLGRQTTRTEVIAERITVMDDADWADADSRYDYEVHWRD